MLKREIHTLDELKERLKEACDTDTFLEIMDISMDDLVEYFEDKIEDQFTYLVSFIEEELF